MERCPRKVLNDEQMGWATELYIAIALATAEGNYPFAGGFYDQPATFANIYPLMRGQILNSENERQKRAVKQ